MGKMIYAGGKCKNPKKKPGWQEAAKAEAEWLAKINSTPLFNSSKYKGRVSTDKTLSPIVDSDKVIKRGEATQRIKSLPSKVTAGGDATKAVIRPEIMYKDNPEMVEREKLARERKFATAPAYNKGGDVLVTDEMMKDITAGKTRRR
jgi:hypothetical protein